MTLRRRWPAYSKQDLATDLASNKPSTGHVAAIKQLRDQLGCPEAAQERDRDLVLRVIRCRCLRLAEELSLAPTLSIAQRAAVAAAFARFGGDAGGAPAEAASDLEAVGQRTTPALLARCGVTAAPTAAAWARAMLQHPQLCCGGDDGSARSSAAASGMTRIEKDAREIQTVRDIERDALCIDGVAIAGAAGFTAVAASLTARFATHAAAVRWWGHAPPQIQLDAFAKLTLRAANRTESGGVSFDTIAALVAAAPAAVAADIIIVPNSAGAEPLQIATSGGAYRAPCSKHNAVSVPQSVAAPMAMAAGHSAHVGGSGSSIGGADSGGDGQLRTLGLRAHVEAITRYAVYDAAHMDAPLLRITARYRNRIYLALSPPHKSCASSSNQPLIHISNSSGSNGNRTETRTGSDGGGSGGSGSSSDVLRTFADVGYSSSAGLVELTIMAADGLAAVESAAAAAPAAAADTGWSSSDDSDDDWQAAVQAPAVVPSRQPDAREERMSASPPAPPQQPAVVRQIGSLFDRFGG